MIPLVTIGLPVYNAAHFLKYSLHSILNQTYQDFELIITDDGSTDETVNIINSFGDARIKLIVDAENRGIAYRLNQQINLAKGKYFVRMDGDDIMFPDRVEKQVKYLEEHPEIDVVGSKAIIIDDKNNVIGIRGGTNKTYKINDLFLAARFIHPTVAGHTKWFSEWKYKECMSGCEDVDLWIRSFNSSCFADMEMPLLFYRDPLKFKLRTYFFRQQRVLQSIWTLRHLMQGNVLLFYCIIKVFLSSFIALFLSILGKDTIMITRRNQIVENKEYYQKILESMIN